MLSSFLSVLDGRCMAPTLTVEPVSTYLGSLWCPYRLPKLNEQPNTGATSQSQTRASRTQLRLIDHKTCSARLEKRNAMRDKWERNQQSSNAAAYRQRPHRDSTAA